MTQTGAIGKTYSWNGSKWLEGSEDASDVEISDGKGIWINCNMSAATTLQSSGKVDTEDIVVRLNGDGNRTAIGNGLPVGITLSNIVPETEAFVMLSCSMFAQQHTPLNTNGQERFLRNTGGWILNPGSMSGKVVCVNCQKGAKRAWIAESVAYFRRATKFNIVIEDAAFDLKDSKVLGNASLFVVDDPALLSILCARKIDGH